MRPTQQSKHQRLAPLTRAPNRDKIIVLQPHSVSESRRSPHIRLTPLPSAMDHFAKLESLSRRYATCNTTHLLTQNRRRLSPLTSESEISTEALIAGHLVYQLQRFSSLPTYAAMQRVLGQAKNAFKSCRKSLHRNYVAQLAYRQQLHAGVETALMAYAASLHAVYKDHVSSMRSAANVDEQERHELQWREVRATFIRSFTSLMRAFSCRTPRPTTVEKAWATFTQLRQHNLHGLRPDLTKPLRWWNAHRKAMRTMCHKPAPSRTQRSLWVLRRLLATEMQEQLKIRIHREFRPGEPNSDKELCIKFLNWTPVLCFLNRPGSAAERPRFAIAMHQFRTTWRSFLHISQPNLVPQWTPQQQLTLENIRNSFSVNEKVRAAQVDVVSQYLDTDCGIIAVSEWPKLSPDESEQQTVAYKKTSFIYRRLS